MKHKILPSPYPTRYQRSARVGTSVMPFNRYVGSGIFVALAL